MVRYASRQGARMRAGTLEGTISGQRFKYRAIIYYNVPKVTGMHTDFGPYRFKRGKIVPEAD
jgi:hypothetical protein